MKQLRSNRLGLLCLSFLLCLGVGVGLSSTHNKTVKTNAESLTISFDLSNTSTTGLSGNSYTKGSFIVDDVSFSVTNIMTTGQYRVNNSTVSSNFNICNTTAIGGSITSITMATESADNLYSCFKITWGSGKAPSAPSSSSGTAASTVEKSNLLTWSTSSSNSYDFFAIAVVGKQSGTNKATTFTINYEKAAESPVSKITLTDQQTQYHTYETFSFTGKCLAELEDGSSTYVNPTSISEPDMTTIGEKTITVSYTYGGATATATYTINVAAYPYIGNGTLANPYTISDAIQLAKTGGTESEVYVKGENGSASISTYYGNGTITFESNGEKFLFYRCLADKDTKFTTDTVGDTIESCIGYGQIINYNGTYELALGCYLYDYKATSISASTPTTSGLKVGDTISSLFDLGINVTANIEVTGEQRDVTEEVTFDNITLVKGTNSITVKYTQTNKYSRKTTNNTELTTTITLDNIPQKATKIEITSDVTEVYLGETITLTAKVSPDDTSDPTVLWISDDDNIATINENTGVVTGVATGQVKMTACCDDVEASVTIEVKDPNNILEEIIVEGTLQTSEYFVGEKFDPTGLTVSGMYTDTTIIDITDQVVWPSNAFTEANDETIITVSYTYTEHNVEKTITDSSTTVKVVDKVLSSIAISGQKTNYTVSDTKVDTSSMKVTASYENTSRTFDVSGSSDITVSYNIDFSKLGENDVTVSYTEKGVTKSTTYTVTVGVGDMTVKVKTQGTAGYKKVTADKEDWSGTYLIVYENDNVAYNGNDTSKQGNYSVSISDSFITYSESFVTVTIAKTKTDGKYSLLLNGGTNSGKYVGRSSNSNGIDLTNTSVDNTISFNTDGTINIIGSGGAYLRYNASTDEGRFRYFKSSTYTGQKAICLYEYSNGETQVEHSVSNDLYTTVQEANAALVCGSSSTGAWVEGNYDEATAKGYLEMLDTADLNLLKTAEADKDGNLVEYFLWKYDYLVATNKITNFLNRNVSTSSSNAIYKFNSNNNQIVLISVIISCLGIATLGGALLLKKRKEN